MFVLGVNDGTLAAEQDIKQLFERYRSGQCSAEEIVRLYDHFGIDANRAVLEERIADALANTDEAPRALVYRAQQVADRVGARLRERVVANPNPPGPRPRSLRWLPYAAAAMLAVAIGWWAIGQRLAHDGQETVPTLAGAVDIAPGANRATLTLADGRSVDLSEAQAGIIIGSDDITYQDGVSLGLSTVGAGGGTAMEELVLTTPNGGTYQITLPDGSRVWLNAASTLKYPSRFSADERVVFLEGEAFFSVTRQPSAGGSMPFRVVTDGQTIEVLGTEFNVSAYADEVETKTTLAEGSVQIVNQRSGTVNRIAPGQQAVTREGHTDIRHVDVAQYTAWKSGRFHFNRTPFGDMIGQVARWYDVEVVYRGAVPKETFTGKMGRDLSLMEMLGLMDISDAAIRLEGRTLVVQ